MYIYIYLDLNHQLEELSITTQKILFTNSPKKLGGDGRDGLGGGNEHEIDNINTPKKNNRYMNYYIYIVYIYNTYMF